MRRRALWTMPYGLYVVGSRAGDRRNLMTSNWATQVSFEPKLLGVGIEKPAVTHELVDRGRRVRLNTIDREDRAIVRKFTKPVEVDLDADAGRSTASRSTTGVTGAPILDQAPAWFDCEVRQAVDLGNHTFFIGEVVAAASRRTRTPRCSAWRTPA